MIFQTMLILAFEANSAHTILSHKMQLFVDFNLLWQWHSKFQFVPDILAVDFGLLLPPCPVNPVNARSEVEMFNDLLTFRKDRTNLIERSIDKLLVHPLSQVYLHIKWEQLWKLFYVMLAAHFAFSLIYSGYSLFVYRILCHPVGPDNTRFAPSNDDVDCTFANISKDLIGCKLLIRTGP